MGTRLGALPRILVAGTFIVAVVLVVCEILGQFGYTTFTPTSSLVKSFMTQAAPVKPPTPLLAYARQKKTAAIAVKFALSQRGKPYIAGRHDLGGYDCSGLVYAAYRHAGLKWPMMTSFRQRTSLYVTPVAAKDVLPGDLIFYDFLRDYSQIPRGLPGPNGVDHVGIVVNPQKGISVEAVGGRGVILSSYKNGRYLVSQVISFGRVMTF
jgi:cell wall-associated NlpC family hydrolase